MLNPIEQAELEQLRHVWICGRALAIGLLIAIAGLVGLACLTPKAAPILLFGALVELIAVGILLSNLRRVLGRVRELEGFLS